MISFVGSPEDSRSARLPCLDSGGRKRIRGQSSAALRRATSKLELQSGQKQRNALNPTGWEK